MFFNGQPLLRTKDSAFSEGTVGIGTDRSTGLLVTNVELLMPKGSLIADERTPPGAGWKPLCIARFFQGIGKVGTGRPYREMAAFHDWLAARPEVDPDRVGMAGFCAGGGFAMLYAACGGRRRRTSPSS